MRTAGRQICAVPFEMCLINDVGLQRHFRWAAGGAVAPLTVLARRTSLTSLTRRKNTMGPSLLTCACMFHSVRRLLEVFLVDGF
jgi:hypothetical protein